MVLVVSMTPVMYSDISGESIILTLAIVGLVVGGGVGALISYNDNGEVNVSDVLLYAALGMAVGLTAGAAWEIFTAYQVTSIAAELSFAVMMDGDPTNEVESFIEISERISDPGFKNVFSDYIKGCFNPTHVGNGTTADAIRHTKTTGELVYKSNHIVKGHQLIDRANKFINSGTLNRFDLSTAYNMIKDLRNALEQ